MTAARPSKIPVDAETLELERQFMVAMAKIRERLAREIEEGLLTTLEDVLNSPVTLKTPAKFKFTQG